MNVRITFMVRSQVVHHNFGEYVEEECVGLRCKCYPTHHRVMSQARDDFEGFLKAHMTKEEKVIVHVETSLSV